MFSQALGIIYLAVGFGFVIFWHELGHFLAAKSVGIKCEQFAVGFGQAIFAWRKGIGFKTGSTKKEYDEQVRGWLKAKNGTDPGEEISPADEMAASQALGLGETEYRLNWIPLGGYVKMLGQDDLNPNAQSADPRSFNRKSVPARMLVVSAGVIMNVILAMIGFAIVFAFGFDAPPAVVGMVIQGSPAQKAGLQVGDRIAYLNDSYQHDFSMLAPNVALAGEDSLIKLNVEKPNGQYFNTTVTPERQPGDSGKGFLELGVGQPLDLIGPVKSADTQQMYDDKALFAPEWTALKPEEKIIAVNGQPLAKVDSAQVIAKNPSVRPHDFDAKRQNLATLDQAIQNSHGKPVELTVQAPDGKTRSFDLTPQFAPPFDGNSTRLAGMALPTGVDYIDKSSPVKDQLRPGDVFTQIATDSSTSPAIAMPTIEQLRHTLTEAGANDQKVNLTLSRNGTPIHINGIETTRLARGRYGLNVGLMMASEKPVVGHVDPQTPADRAGLAPGMTITSINGKPVANWFEVRDALGALQPGENAKIEVAGGKQPLTLAGLSGDDLKQIQSIRYEQTLPLRPMSMPRQTSNPWTAMVWGVGETKDLLVQGYVSLRRIIDGSVPASGMMGPVGIFAAGTGFAAKGNVWLLWFLSMISANLAIVNFLPIPIVDGGLFTFLILEKIQGRPLSPKTHAVAQIVGLALLGFVLLFATWQDIARFF